MSVICNSACIETISPMRTKKIVQPRPRIKYSFLPAKIGTTTPNLQKMNKRLPRLLKSK